MDRRIGTLLRTDFLTLAPGMSIREAVARLVATDLSAAPVLDDAGALIGILTHKDCFRSALHAGYYRQWTGTVAEHMTAEVRTLEADTDVVAAAEAFLSDTCRAFPVMRGDRLIGMLDRADLLRAFLDDG